MSIHGQCDSYVMEAHNRRGDRDGTHTSPVVALTCIAAILVILAPEYHARGRLASAAASTKTGTRHEVALVSDDCACCTSIAGGIDQIARISLVCFAPSGRDIELCKPGMPSHAGGVVARWGWSPWLVLWYGWAVLGQAYSTTVDEGVVWPPARKESRPAGVAPRTRGNSGGV